VIPLEARTEDDVHQLVTARLRRSPDQAVWDQLVEDRWPQDLLAEAGVDREEILEDLVQKVRTLEGRFITGRRATAAGTTTESLLYLWNERADGIARLQAIEANELPEVVAFRRQVLRGRLLQDSVHKSNVASWIEREAKKQKPPLGAQTLAYFRPLESQIYEIRVQEDGKLGRLREVVSSLVERYGWLPAHAVRFVLTGHDPQAFSSLVTINRGASPAADRIVLTLSPWVSPQEVARIYSEARAAVRKPMRDVIPLTVELAVFAAQRNDGRPWREVMIEWNRRFPRHPRREVKRFTRDCREAYRKIMGERLAWKSQRGSRG